MTANRQELVSRAAGLAYPIRDGVPIMLPGEARELSDEERDAMTAEPWPSEIRAQSGRDILTVALRRWRALSRCAPNICAWNRPAPKCAAMAATQAATVTGKEHVKIARLEPVGNYAVRIVFDDGHDSGLYSWDYLHKLGRRTAI